MQKLTNKKRKGFTLVEIIIVVIIIGILAALIVPRFTDATSQAKKSAALAEHRTVVGEVLTKIAAATGTALDAATIKNQFTATLQNGTTVEVVGTTQVLKVTTTIPGGLESTEQISQTDAATKGGSADTATQKVTYLKVK